MLRLSKRALRKNKQICLHVSGNMHIFALQNRLINTYMDIKQLKAFFYVAETQSFTSAASWCNITKSAVSQHVKALEEELSTTLIIRSAKDVQLTESGCILYEYTKRFINESQYCKDSIESLKGDLKGTIRIGVGSFIGPYIRKAAVEMRRRYPGVKFDMISSDTRTLNHKLRNHELDVAYTMNISEANEGIQTMPSIPFRVYAIMNKTHMLAKKKKISIDDIIKNKVVLPDAGRRVYDTIYRYISIDLNSLQMSAKTNSVSEILGFVEETNDITFLPKIHISHYPNLIAIPIEGLEFDLVSNAHWMKDVPLKKSVEVFIDLVKDFAVPYFRNSDLF